MKKFLMSAVAISSLVLGTAGLRAEDKKEESKDKGVNGVMIDAACGAKQKTEKDAIAHPKTCAMKEGCAASGYGIFKGDKFIKFDEKGNEKAKKYLAVKENGMKVHIDGKMSEDGKTLNVTDIHPQKDKKEEKKEDKKEEEVK